MCLMAISDCDEAGINFDVSNNVVTLFGPDSGSGRKKSHIQVFYGVTTSNVDYFDINLAVLGTCLNVLTLSSVGYYLWVWLGLTMNFLALYRLLSMIKLKKHFWAGYEYVVIFHIITQV